MKECLDEIDLGTQYHLSRYAFLCESIVHSEATILQPQEENGTSLAALRSYTVGHGSLAVFGLKATMESIDNRSDFKTWMHAYVYAHGGHNNRGPRRNGPQEEGFVRSPIYCRATWPFC